MPSTPRISQHLKKGGSLLRPLTACWWSDKTITKIRDRTRGLTLTALPSAWLTDKAAILLVLDEIQQFLEAPVVIKRKGRSDEEWSTPNDAVRYLRAALHRDCISADDVRTILSRPVQFLLIYEVAIDQRVGFSREDREPAVGGLFIELLLFYLELLDPTSDRLRRPRVRFESDLSTPSPEPILATWGWEKTIRGDKAFRVSSSRILGALSALGKGEAPYWIYSSATLCPEMRFVFLALDEHFDPVPALTLELVKIMEEDPMSWMGPYYRPIFDFDGQQMDVDELSFCCKFFNLEMMGTPFLVPPLTDELHVCSQRPVITRSWHDLQVTIPAFYTPEHLHTLRENDFAELHRLMAHRRRAQARPKKEKPKTGGRSALSLYDLPHLVSRDGGRPEAAHFVRKPDMDSAPLTDEEMGAVARAIRRVISDKYSKYQSYKCAQVVLSLWWTMPAHNEKATRLARVLGNPPAPSATERHWKPPSRASIIELVNAGIDACAMPSRRRYAWFKFLRAYKRVTPTS